MIELSVNYCCSIILFLSTLTVSSQRLTEHATVSFPTSLKAWSTSSFAQQLRPTFDHFKDASLFKEPSKRTVITDNNEPFFVTKESNNVTAPLGGMAYLQCRIIQLGDRTVSWVRQADLHIITSGNYTYTSDQRFRAIHLPQTNDWTLEVREAQLTDSGCYECQVSTETKLSLSVYLQVIVVKTDILEGPSLYLQKGATINLTCTVNYSPDESSSSFIFWYHNEKLINYSGEKRGVDVRTERMFAKDGLGSMLSRLLIKEAMSSDSGNYSCQLTTASVAPAHVNVYVLNNGENPAAMQTGETRQEKGAKQDLSPINNTSNNKRLNAQTNQHLFHALLAAPLLAWYKSQRIQR